MSDEPDLEFARDQWFAENVPTTFVAPGCPCLLIVLPLEGPIFLDFKGDFDRLWDWLSAKGQPSLVTLLEQGVALAREGRGE